MKKSHFFQVCLCASLGLGFLAFVKNAQGADDNAESALSQTNLAPQSVFDLSRPYKDPFFPNSTRSRRVTATNTNAAPAFSDDQFVLRGLSGVPGQEVAIINNRNLAAGERGEVTLSSGATVWITVNRIDRYSATIIPDGARVPLTISLPKDDQ